MPLHLSVYGATITVDASNEAVINLLQRDFAYFVAEPLDGPPDLVLSAHHGAPLPGLIPATSETLTVTPHSISYRHGNSVYTDFHGRGLLVYDFAAREGTAYGKDELVITQILRLVLTRKLREQLELRRIHTFPWLSLAYGKFALLLLGLPGTGKTTLTLDLLDSGDFGLLGDARSLITLGGEVLPFPRGLYVRGDRAPGIPADRQTSFHSLGQEPNVMVDIDYFGDAVPGACYPRMMALCTRLASESPRVEWIPRSSMVRYVHRHNRALHKLLGGDPFSRFPRDRAVRNRRHRIAAERTFAALRALARSRTCLVYLGSNRRANAAAIAEAVHGEREDH